MRISAGAVNAPFSEMMSTPPGAALTDAKARSVASWWAFKGNPAFTSLATSGSVDAEALREEIARELHVSNTLPLSDYKLLVSLAAWSALKEVGHPTG